MIIKELYELYKQHPTVTIDSRKIDKGSIFIGIRGERFDGNEFAEDALQKGAAYAIVDKDATIEAKDFSQQLIRVDDTIATLQALATFHRQKLEIPVIGITGSNGKTTTKELLNAILNQKFHTFATPGNLNNHLGLPLSILQIHDQFEMGVLEFGANHPGEHALLCNIAKPTHGLITNIGKDHLEGYGGMEGVKNAHKEFIDHLENEGRLFFQNQADPIILELAENLYRVSFGPEDLTPKADFRGRIARHFPTLNIEITQTLNPEEPVYSVETNLYGGYNFFNLLSAICIGQYFGISEQGIQAAVKSYHPHNNRSEVLEWRGATVILDAYNANPSSMKAALDEFDKIESDQKMVILGDMFELGAYSEQEHQSIIRFLKNKNWTKVLVGEMFGQFRAETEGLFFEDRGTAKAWLDKQELGDYWILIKGSRGMALEKLLKGAD